jgi:tyrosine-protein kinase Etk/Wzc
MNQPIQQLQSTVAHNDTIDLARYFSFLYDNRLRIACIALAVTLLGATYAFLVTPVYQANILLQVEHGTGPVMEVLGNFASSAEQKIGASSDMEILRSRMVVSRAVDNLHMYIKVQPKYFPVIGEWIARGGRRLSVPGLFGHGGYVWGAERTRIARFNVPPEMEGETFILTAEENGRFRLQQRDGAVDIGGKTGVPIEAPAGTGTIDLLVDRIDALPGAEFLLVRASRDSTIERLQDALAVSEKGKQSGIIRMTLDGTNPALISATLNEIGRGYLHQNDERKAMDAEKLLAFINVQLPQLKQQVELSEKKYNELRNERGTFDLGEEGRTILRQSADAQTRMSELRQRKEELLIRFQESHPFIEAINQQMKVVQRVLANSEARIRRLPAIEQDVLRLTRDVKVNTDVYTAVLSTAQQLRLLAASKVGNSRLLDPPVTPTRPVKPQRLLIIVVAAALGLALGVIAALFRKALYRRIDDPHEIKQLLGMRVSVTIPHSDGQDQLYAQIQGRLRAVSVLAYDAPADGAVESLRGFRTSLQYGMRDARSNIIVMTSPTPEVGKSFVSANISAVMGAAGKKVLLIDADLRRGHLHRYFGLDRTVGLVDTISSTVMPDHVIHRNVVENVDFISTGSATDRPAELLSGEKFEDLLRQMSARYDFVLIDTAPVLAVSDALVVGRHAGAVFNVVRGGVSTVGEIEETVRRLNEVGATVTGTVFNDLKPGPARYAYGLKYGKYQYAA